jgi:hypothetical protein
MKRYGPSVLAALLLLSAACQKSAPLTEQRVSSARKQWAALGLRNYRVRLTIEGDRIQEGDFEIDVRDGRIANLKRNGVPVESRDAFYTVDGMFKFLMDELDMATNPALYWQAPKGTRIHQRAAFHEQKGYVTRYIRAVVGTKHNISIKVSDLEPLS